MEQEKILAEEWGPPVWSLDELPPCAEGFLKRPEYTTCPSLFSLRYGAIYDLRKCVEAKGVEAINESLLERIYGPLVEGQNGERLPAILTKIVKYSRIRSAANPHKPAFDPEELKAVAIEALDEELLRISKLWDKLIDKFLNRVALREQTAFLLPKDDLDRFERYTKGLDNAIERNLNRLERSQRQRLGDRVLPPVQVRLSHA